MDAVLIDTLVQAIVKSTALVLQAHSGEELSAYALCTDDSLSTLFHVATSREYCARNADVPDVRFVATTWEYTEGEELFETARQLLRSRYEKVAGTENFPEHVRDAFGDLVEALKQVRESGLWAPNVLVYATSTDPGPELERLAREGASLLNSAQVFEEWCEAMGY